MGERQGRFLKSSFCLLTVDNRFFFASFLNIFFRLFGFKNLFLQQKLSSSECRGFVCTETERAERQV